MMTNAILVSGIIIIVLGLVILDRCKSIHSELQWLRARFVSKRPSEFGRPINLADELESLAPLYFIPFVDVASEIRRVKATVAKKMDQSVEFWEQLELQEMEAFATKSNAYEKSFTPSTALISAQKLWFIERLKLDQVGEWEALFQTVFLNLIAGKLDITEAKNELERINFTKISMLDIEGKRKAEEFFSSNNSEWSAGKWNKRMELLRELKNPKNS